MQKTGRAKLPPFKKLFRACATTTFALSLAVGLVACGSGGGSSSSSAAAPSGTVSIGGTVSGLTGSGLVLQSNAGDNLAIPANGSFTKATALAIGASYSVTASSQPSMPNQTCTVSNGSGTASTSITNVRGSCTTPAVRFAYVANSGANTVSAYTVDASTGALTQLGSYSTGTDPASVVTTQ